MSQNTNPSEQPDLDAELQQILDEAAHEEVTEAVEGVTEAREEPVTPDDQGDRLAELEQLVAERTADLQRIQAEYVNYKRRVDRDRASARQAGAAAVITDLLPVLDSIDLARQHDDMTQGFEMVAEALDKLAAKHGLVGFGAVGDPFDPTRHEALMQVPLEDREVTEPTVSQVIQIGYTLGERVLRPARVAVANP